MDNMESWVGTSTDLLTTIDPNLTALGAAAADFLLQALGGQYQPGIHLQDCSLIVGETTVGPGANPIPADERVLGP